MRLQKILSQAGVASRRKSETLILSGKVSVNGKIVKVLGTQVDPIHDEIRVAGKKISRHESFHYFAYYKPRGKIVTKKDELGRKGIFAELKLPKQVNSVGRLDKNSEGLLLLSDDGTFIQEYTHPSFQVPKVYQVKISRALTQTERQSILRGIPLEEKEVKAHAVKKLAGPEGFWVELELREGVKREIRRIMEFFGIKVLSLKRIRHGSVTLGRMKPGELKTLSSRPA